MTSAEYEDFILWFRRYCEMVEEITRSLDRIVKLLEKHDVDASGGSGEHLKEPEYYEDPCSTTPAAYFRTL